MSPFHLKFALKIDPPALKNADFDQYLLITSQPYVVGQSGTESRGKVVMVYAQR